MTNREKILCALAAGAGFVLMVFELVAARMLAPAVGSSTYVWTSVIGVIVAALSVGYWLGGRVADVRRRESDVALLFVLAAVAMATTLLSYEQVLQMVTSMRIDVRWQAVLSAIVLFAPTSALLGAISPYLAKLNVTSLKSSGRSVANLGALNSVGGIVGTFFAGFFLFGIMGIRWAVVWLVVLAVVLGWLLVPRQQLRRRLVLSFTAIFVAVLSALSPTVLAIDTASAHYIIDDQIGYYGQVRSLVTSPHTSQSGVYVNDPNALVFWYTKEMADIIASRPEPGRILMLGGGAYTLPRYLAHTYPKAQIDVVEIDPELINISRQYFNYDDPANVHNIAADARTYLNHNTTKYDVILVDVFGGDAVPATLMTREFGGAIKSATADGGYVLANIIAGHNTKCEPLFEASARPYLDRFAYATHKLRWSEAASTNIIGIFSDTEIGMIGYAPITKAGPVYTDEYIPADQLYFACRG